MRSLLPAIWAASLRGCSLKSQSSNPNQTRLPFTWWDQSISSSSISKDWMQKTLNHAWICFRFTVKVCQLKKVKGPFAKWHHSRGSSSRLVGTEQEITEQCGSEVFWEIAKEQLVEEVRTLNSKSGSSFKPPSSQWTIKTANGGDGSGMAGNHSDSLLS